MKKYYYLIYFILTSIIFFLSLILNLKPSIQGFCFVLLCSSIGMLIGDYLRIRKNISISTINKKLIINILIVSILSCLVLIITINHLILKQVLIFCSLFASSIIAIYIVFFKNKEKIKSER